MTEQEMVITNQDVLNKAKLNWTVRKEEIVTKSGIEILDNFAVIRNDTNKILSVRGKDYTPYQNHELSELLFKVSSMTGLKIVRGGFFGEGEKVYIQLKADDMRLGNDRIEGYLTGINSFDGSTSLAFGPTTKTISCQNTFFAAFREMNTRIRHTKNMNIRVDEVCRALEVSMKEEKEIFTNIKRLSEIPIDSIAKERFTRQFFDIPKELTLTSDELSTRTKNQLSRFYVDMHGEMAEKGETLWGFFSGITKYTTHTISENRKNYVSDSKMYNNIGRKEQKIFNELVSMS